MLGSNTCMGQLGPQLNKGASGQGPAVHRAQHAGMHSPTRAQGKAPGTDGNPPFPRGRTQIPRMPTQYAGMLLCSTVMQQFVLKQRS